MASHASADISGFRIAPVQEQIWSEQKGSALFFTQCAIRCDAPLTSEQVVAAARRLTERYEILRTRYHVGDGRRFPLQVILESAGPAIVEESGDDIAHLVLPGVDGLTGEEPRSLRIALSGVGESGSRLLLSLPSMSGDSRTLLLLAEELIAAIRSDEGTKEESSDDDEVLQYAQYAEWSRQFADEPDEEAVAHWKSIAENRAGPLQLSWRGPATRAGIAALPLGIADGGASIRALAERLAVPPGDLLTGLWTGFVGRLGRGNSVEIACDLHGREFEELAGVVGPVGRTVPLVVDASNGIVADLLRDVAGRLDVAREASDFYPFDRVEDRNGRTVAVEIVEVGASELPGCEVEFVRSVRNGFALKLSCVVREHGDISAELLYDAALLDRGSAATISEMFEAFVRNAAADTEQAPAAYPLLDDGRLNALHAEWNANGEVASEREDVLASIERAAAAEPEAVAVIERGKEFTYADLMHRAGAVAAELAGRGIGRGDVVPICLERSFDAVAVMLGVMKAGAAFLPLDPKLPESRRAFMAQDSGAKLVATSQEWVSAFDGVVPALLLSDIRSAPAPAATDLDPEDPAYVIYTSGSTGTPKGCIIRRRNIAAYVGWALDYYFERSGAEGNWPLFTSLSFDLTLTSIFCSLSKGGSVTIFGDEMEMPEVLRAIFSPDSAIDIVKMTPAQASLLGTTGLKRTGVRAVILGGEQLRNGHVETLRKLNPEIRIFNEYGPTETTIGCIVAMIGDEDARITIGEPIPGARAYIADENGRLVAPYETGELWIAGAGVGAGYLNRPELTAERFRSDLPFLNGATAYRTGDLARRYPDGRLEYLGRNDDQLKVRGYRVELGEIRACLLNVEGVRDGIVTAHDGGNGDSELVAYYVAAVPLDEETIAAALRRSLPDYMIPQFFVPLEAIPLTVNGKPDTASLPDPRSLMEKGEYVAPRNDREERIAGIFAAVLGVERVGVHEDFFRLGGHSLRAMRAIAQVNMALGTDLKVGAIFEHPSVAGLAEIAATESAGAAQGSGLAIEAAEDRDRYELSDAQRRLWVLEQMEDLGDAYHIAGVFDLEGEFSEDAFARAFGHIVERHEILRTTFHVVDGMPVQRVNHASISRVEFVDLRDETDAAAAMEKHVRRFVTDPFDLERGPLIRAAILRSHATRRRLIIAMHHIVSDGWSVGILIRELVALYRAYADAARPELPDLPIRYADFAVWQQKGLREGRLDGSRDYWLERLANATPLDLPVDMPRPQRKSYRGGTERFALDAGTLAELERLASETGTSLFMVLLALLETLLHRYTGQEDITIGTAIAGRDRAELEDQVGFYVNVLPLRNTVRGEETFADLLRRVRETATGAYAHQSYPFDRLIDELGVERETGRSPLFDVFVVLQNNEQEVLRFGDAVLTECPLPNSPNKYDLSFDFNPTDNGLHCEVNYNSDIFLPERIRNLVSHLTALTTAVLSKHGTATPISSLPILTDADLDIEAVREMLSAMIDPRPEQGLADVIDGHAMRHPDKEAIAFEHESISYEELRRRSNGIANLLAGLMSGADGRTNRIAVVLPRSNWIPLLLVSTLKAGGTYVPIDGDYPVERIRTMLGECDPALVVTDPAGAEKLAEISGIVTLDELGKVEPRNERPDIERAPDSVAAIIFTSGSTGRPKGVMIEERGLLNTVAGMTAGIEGFAPDARFLLFASPSFDGSLNEMLLPLLNGATVVAVSRDVIEDAAAFTSYVESKNVTAAILPPAYLATLNRHPLPTIRTLVTAGEAPVPADAMHYASTREYVNAYGPSECSICATFYQVKPDGDYRLGIPVGTELANTRMFVLDRYGNMLPDGYDGELCIAGAGTGPGYLNDEQTARAFFEHPLLPGVRVYRTGDIGRRLFDGSILFRGRADHQVKVRGHRVEPEEISKGLQEHPELIDAAVVARRPPGESVQLVAFVVSKAGGANLTMVRSWLSERLPTYMVPSFFFEASELPTTPNGKVDREKLLAEAERRIGSERRIEGGREPRTDEERALAEATAHVLGLARVSPDDNYFMLGGDSIKAIQITWRLRELGWGLHVRDIFAHPVLAEAATRLRREDATIEEEKVEGDVPLTPIQRWFFEKTEPRHRDRFNQSVLLRAEGGRLNAATLGEALKAVAERHDMLRARFDTTAEPPRQIVSADPLVSIEEIDLTGIGSTSASLTEELERTHASISIADESLLRAKLIRTGDGDILHLVAHHLIVDVISWHILIADLIAAYAAIEEQRDMALPPKTASYRTWSERCIERAGSEKIGEARRWWLRIAGEHADAGMIPVNMSASNTHADAVTLTVALDARRTAQLLTDVHDAYNTEARDILVAALGEALCRETGGDSCTIALEGHGRSGEEIGNVDVGRTVGWFTALYPVHLRKGRDRGHAIKEAKERLRSIPMDGLSYGLCRYPRTEAEGLPDLLTGPTQIVLNYLGAESEGGLRGLFTLGAEPEGIGFAPEASRPFEIEVLASIAGAEFRATFTWGEGRIERGTIERLAAGWIEEIERIVDHALEVEAPELTPSDVDYDGLSIDDLDDILSNITM